jgi:hypothetical protein
MLLELKINPVRGPGKYKQNSKFLRRSEKKNTAFVFYWRCEYLAAKLLSSRDNLSFAKRRWGWSSQQGHSEGHLSFQHQDHFADIVRQSSLNLHVVGSDISVIKHFWRRWLGQTNTNCICAVELCIFSISTLALHEIAKPSIPARDAAALRFRFRCVS